MSFQSWSRPVRARGLKLGGHQRITVLRVAPRAGAWIETPYQRSAAYLNRRAPCGRVD